MYTAMGVTDTLMEYRSSNNNTLSTPQLEPITTTEQLPLPPDNFTGFISFVDSANNQQQNSGTFMVA